MDLSSIIDWVEEHDKTVDMIKWIGVLAIAWVTGAFRLLRKYTIRPKATVIETASRCHIEIMDGYEGYKNAARTIFLIDANIVNRSSETIVVEHFRVKYKDLQRFKRWSKALYSITLPCRPRQQMGEGTKLSKTFFTHFADGCDTLTMSGIIDPKHFQNGYILFVASTHGFWNPRVIGDGVIVRLEVYLTTGEKLKTKVKIPITTDEVFLENFVPGIFNYVKHPAASGAFVDA